MASCRAPSSRQPGSSQQTRDRQSADTARRLGAACAAITCFMESLPVQRHVLSFYRKSGRSSLPEHPAEIRQQRCPRASMVRSDHTRLRRRPPGRREHQQEHGSAAVPQSGTCSGVGVSRGTNLVTSEPHRSWVLVLRERPSRVTCTMLLVCILTGSQPIDEPLDSSLECSGSKPSLYPPGWYPAQAAS